LVDPCWYYGHYISYILVFLYALSLSVYGMPEFGVYLGLGLTRARDATRVTRPAIESDAFLSKRIIDMLRRTPTTIDGKTVDKYQESTRINKPFKVPTPVVQRAQPQRKRKRVSYKETRGTDDDTDSDSGSKTKKRRQSIDAACPADEICPFPVYKPKPFNELFGPRRYTIPVMTNKNGEIIKTIQSNPSLGIRPQIQIIPRPLHDPMEDHAIVLYDPTVDMRETDEERKAREKEELRAQAEKEAREKTAGQYNPHKSLRELLGGGIEKKTHSKKVPVVIDPRLSKVLRPHQVEGVKVRTTLI
jgi:DNA repair and recombination RAD54-like protein